MIICKTDEHAGALIRDTESQGFEWHTPMFLDSESFWDDTDVPQVEDHCPNCRMLTDRYFNMTTTVDGWHWTLHHCLSCNSVWFEKEIT